MGSSSPKGERFLWMILAKRDVPGSLWAVLATGLIIRLVLACTNVRTLLLLNVPDDAFYALRLPQNIAAGHGPTFDGLHSTNGFHPLWTVVLCLLSRVCPAGPSHW